MPGAQGVPFQVLSWLRPGVFFPETAFCGVWRDRAGYGENSSGLKTRFFLANPSPARKILTFFSPTLPRRGKFKIFPRHGGELAHFCVFWRGICTFGEEFVCFGEARHAPARKILTFFLANPAPARKILAFFSPSLPRWGNFKIFPRRGLSLPQISPPRRPLKWSPPCHS